MVMGLGTVNRFQLYIYMYRKLKYKEKNNLILNLELK